MIRRLLLALALAIAVGPAHVDHKPDSASNAASRPQHKQRPAQAPITVKLLNTGKSDQETAAEARRIEQEADTSAKMFRLTMVIGAISVLQLFAFIAQAFFMRRTLGQMEREEGRRLRAYVFIDSARATLTTTFGDPACVLVLRNSGQTPAYEVTCMADVCLRDMPTAEPFPDAQRIVQRKIHLGPNSSIAFTVELPALSSLPGPEQVQVLHAIGAITYRDAFGKLRRTRFHMARMVPWGSGDDRMEFEPEGNDAD
jgi:hypothetical protein